MPIDVAVKEPRPRVVGLEPDRDIIVRVAEADNVAHDGVVVVVRRASRAADDVEDVSVQVDRVLIIQRRSTTISILGTVVVYCRLTGPPSVVPPAPPGKDISTL